MNHKKIIKQLITELTKKFSIDFYLNRKCWEIRLSLIKNELIMQFLVLNDIMLYPVNNFGPRYGMLHLN